MSTTSKICLAVLCGICIGLLLSLRKDDDCITYPAEVDTPDDASADSKHTLLQSKEDLPSIPSLKGTPFIDGTPTESAIPPVDPNLARWATRQGIMEVSTQDIAKAPCDDAAAREKWATRQGIMETALCEPKKQKQSSRASALAKWGTRQGVMDVATDKVQEKLADTMRKQRNHELKASQQFYSRLNKDTEVIQVALHNTSDSDKSIILWGRDALTVLPSDQAVARDPVAVGEYPQGIVVNPLNGLVYVANQLSDNISVVDVTGTVVSTIALDPTNPHPGTTSPVHLTVHSLTGRPGYGKVYVANSVANTVSVIDTSLQLIRTIPVGSRPVSLAFNAINECVYVANLESRSLSVIDTITDSVIRTIGISIHPRVIGINEHSGEIYAAGQENQDILVCNTTHTLNANIPVTGRVHAFLWHPIRQKMYASLSDGRMASIDPLTYALQILSPVDGAYAMAVNKSTGALYIVNRGHNTITELRDDNSRRVIAARGINIGFVFNPEGQLLLWTNTLQNRMEIAIHETDSSIEADLNVLNSQLQYFQSNPAQVEHVKLVVTQGQAIKHFVIKDTSITGKKSHVPIALSNYESPQHFQKVYEINALKGTMLDNHTRWQFDLPAATSITMLVYHKPLKLDEIFLKNLKQNNTLTKQQPYVKIKST